jgi:hypothetical protein
MLTSSFEEKLTSYAQREPTWQLDFSPSSCDIKELNLLT